jgi:hypothetical protein
MKFKTTILITAVISAFCSSFLTGEIKKVLGTLDSPDTPQNTNSFTLEDIFNRLSSGTAGSSGAFSEPSSGPGSTMYDMNAIMDAAPEADNTNGATAAEVFSGKTFWGLNSGEWGLQSGTYDVPLVRFTDNGDSTVTDNQTGLMWTKNADLTGSISWWGCGGFCNSLTLAGYSDWRLPEIWELFTLVDNKNWDPTLPSGHPFVNVNTSYYGSNTFYPELNIIDEHRTVWHLLLYNGDVRFTDVSDDVLHTWPVRRVQ